MIETILPRVVAAVEAFDDPPGAILYPEEEVTVSRIQLNCTPEAAHGIMPTPLSSIDVPTPFKDSCIVGHRAHGDGQFAPGTIVIEVAVVKMHSQGEVRLTRIWSQSKS